MALWARLKRDTETWPEMENAARQRFWDGLALACGEAGNSAGAVYLWGYVVEMLLKCASLRVRTNVSPTQNIVPILEQERIKHHHLLNLLNDLRTVRYAASRGLDSVLEGALRNHVDVLEQNWDIGLRYRSSSATEAELREVYEAVEWMVSNYSYLI